MSCGVRARKTSFYKASAGSVFCLEALKIDSILPRRPAFVALFQIAAAGKLVFGISDKRPRQVVGSAAFDQPERTRKGLIDKLKVMVDFQLYEYNGNVF